MNKSFSHLVWLGAGQAKEPTGLIDQAKQVTLVDARESACEYLKKQFSSDHVQVVPKLITVHGGQQSFTEYNLPEYAALQAATGLKKLFPGLKIAHQETMTSVSLKQFFKDLNLTYNENLLVIDLPDVNQAFFEALHKTGELHKFSQLYIFASQEPLYLDALNSPAIVNFLRPVCYMLQKTISVDPDFPCLVFGVIPLWVELQQANQFNAKLASDTKELQAQQETLKQELVKSKQQMDAITKERESLKLQLNELKQLSDSLTKDKEQNKHLEQEQVKQITKLKADFEQATKHAASRLNKLNQLEKSNRLLQETNLKQQKRHQALEQEMIKAEAQIIIIKDFLMKN